MYLPKREYSWSSRAAGIGRGFKYDFTKAHNYSPGPGKYDLMGGDLGRKKLRNFSMGLGREQIYMAGLGPITNTKSTVPGPGHYPFDARLTSIGTKFGTSEVAKPYNAEYPGPGKYIIPSGINKQGRYILSRFRDSGAPRIPMTNCVGGPASRFSYRTSMFMLTQTPKHRLLAFTKTSTP